MLSKLSRIIKESTEFFNNYEYSHTKLETDKFFWQKFCDNYLEIIKDRLYNPGKRGKEARVSAQYSLYHTLLTIIKLMAPIMPFITEEIYQLHYRKYEMSETQRVSEYARKSKISDKAKSIHLTKWPDINMVDEHAEHVGDFVVKVVEFVRKQKSEKQLSLKTPVKKLIIKSKVEEKDFDNVEADIKAATNTEHIVYEPTRGKKTEKELEIEVEFDGII